MHLVIVSRTIRYLVITYLVRLKITIYFAGHPGLPKVHYLGSFELTRVKFVLRNKYNTNYYKER